MLKEEPRNISKPVENINDHEILQEIDLNSTEIKVLKSHLLQNGPESLVAYHFIDNFMQWMLLPFYKFDEDEYWSDAAHLTVYCPEGKIEYGIIVVIAKYKNGRVFIMLHCMSKSSFLTMRDILITTKVINWKKSLTFEGIQNGLQPLIKDVFTKKGISINQLHEKKLLVMPKSLAENIKLKYPEENIYIDRLQLKYSHISLVNYNWDEKGEHTEFIVETLIRNNRAAAIYLRDDASLPLAWAVRQHYGGIGMINSTHLRGYEHSRDYLPLLIRFMIRYYVIDETQAFTCIIENHFNLIEIFTNAGFKNICNLFWITTEGETGYKFLSYLEKFNLQNK